MPHASINGIKLHYQQVGQGPDVVMVHGITGNMAIWHLEIIPALMQQYRLTTYDLRGHGYSDAPPTGDLANWNIPSTGAGTRERRRSPC